METPEVVQRKQKIAELEHQRFVDIMHPYFGLGQHPGYIGIRVRPLLVSGILSRSGIYLSDSDGVEDLSYGAWHESGHFLHNIRNPYMMGELEKSKRFNNRVVLAEIVAELGTLIFLDVTEGLDSKVIEKYSIGPEMNTALNPEDIDIIINIAKQNKGFLEKLAKGNNPHQLVRSVRSYKK